MRVLTVGICGECAACRGGRIFGTLLSVESTNCGAKMCVIGVHEDGGMRDRFLLSVSAGEKWRHFGR